MAGVGSWPIAVFLTRQHHAIHVRVCWRIDYHLATPVIAAKAEAIYLDQRFSDNAPVTIDYGLKI